MRRLPLATLAVVGAILLAYACELGAGGLPVCERLGFVAAHPSLVSALTSIALHDPDHVGHLVGNVLALIVIGSLVEAELGALGLVGLFVAGGLGGALVHLLVDPVSTTALVGASGSIAGLMAVAAVARPRAMLAFVVCFVGLHLVALLGATGLSPGSASVACHVGGFVCGTGTVLLGQARRARLAAA